MTIPVLCSCQRPTALARTPTSRQVSRSEKRSVFRRLCFMRRMAPVVQLRFSGLLQREIHRSDGMQGRGVEQRQRAVLLVDQ